MLRRIIRVQFIDQAEMMTITRDQAALIQGFGIILLLAILGAYTGYSDAVRANEASQFGAAIVSQFDGGLASQLAEIRINPTFAAIKDFLSPFISWALWSIVPFLIGTKIYKSEATFINFARIIPFCLIGGLIPLSLTFGRTSCSIGLFWSLIVGYYAIQTTLGLGQSKSMGTAIISLILVTTATILLQNL